MNQTTKTLHIEGMSCQNCVSHVENALRAVDGVERASVDLAQNQVTVDYVPQVTNLTTIEGAVRQAGYEVVGVVEPSKEGGSKSCCGCCG
jgi:copper chaperone CopZ